MLFPTGVFAQEVKEDQTEPELGSKITCDQVWKIAGSENCERFIVSNDEGGVWCNLPDTRESLQPWIYGPAPTYTFTPNTCQVESETPQSQQPQSDQLEQSNSSADDSKKLQSKSNQEVKPLDVKLFGVNPFQTWLNLRGLAEAGAYIYSGAVIEDIGPIFSPGYAAIQRREAEAKIRSKLSREFLDQGMERILKLESKTGLKNPKEIWDIFPIRAVTEPVIIHQDSATIQVQPLYGEDGVLERNAKSFLELKSGAIDVIVEPKTEEQFQIQTPNAEIVVIGTKFSVLYDPKENQTIVEVYKGKVEVKTKDGKTASVSPNEDKPGAVVVSQKLSPIRLAIAGLVLILIVGGTLFLLKRKGLIASTKFKVKGK